MCIFNQKRFKVKVLGRAGLEYSENGKSIAIDAEMLTGNEYDMIIRLSSISEERLIQFGFHPNDRELIIKRIESEMKNAKIYWE